MALNSGTGRSEVTDEKQTKGKIRMKKGMDTRCAASGRGKEELGRQSSENVQHSRLDHVTFSTLGKFADNRRT
jgi:hypothetical protein